MRPSLRKCFQHLFLLFISRSCTTQDFSNHTVLFKSNSWQNAVACLSFIVTISVPHIIIVVGHILLTNQVLNTSPLWPSGMTYLSQRLSGSFLIKSKGTFSPNLRHFYLCSDCAVDLSWFSPMQICKLESSMVGAYLWCCLNTWSVTLYCLWLFIVCLFYWVIKPWKGTVCLCHCWNFSAYLGDWDMVSIQPTPEWKWDMNSFPTW